MTDEILKKFTNAARKIMALANQATQELNHEYIGPEHMLIGLSRMEFGAGAMALTKMEITPLLVGHTLQKRLTPGQPRVITGKINRTPRADRVIEAARQEAEDSRSPTINSGHLLLGLLHHSEDVSSQVLTELGATLEKALNVLRDLPQSVFEDEDKPNKPTESDFPKATVVRCRVMTDPWVDIFELVVMWSPNSTHHETFLTEDALRTFFRGVYLGSQGALDLPDIPAEPYCFATQV